MNKSTLISLDRRELMSYDIYREVIDNLLLSNKTTGTNHSDAYLNYTKMNVHRMKRLDKRFEWNQELQTRLNNIPPQKWVVLTEAWCGDAAQNIPIIQHMAKQAKINMELILRDENLDLMDQFLTNGGRSIPKLFALDNDKNLLFTWGPRPKNIQETYSRLREEGLEYAEISKEIHTLYAADKGVTIQEEFLELLS